MEKIFCKVSECIDKKTDKYLKFLEDICNFETNSHDKDDINKMVDFILEHEKENNYKVIRKPFEKSGDVVCVDYSDNAEKNIAISAHMDTVYEKGVFGYPTIRKDDTYIYGPGVSDCKGGIAVGFLAMSALKKCGFDTANIRMLLQSDEEVNSSLSDKGTINYICEMAKDSIAFLNLESARKGGMVVTRKGIIRTKFEITGKAVHSKDVNEGINAINEAAFKIMEIAKAELPETIGINCGMINGGTAANIVPDKCSFIVEARICKESEYDDVISFLKGIAQKTFVKGTKTEFTVQNKRVPMELNERNKKLFDKVNEISKDYGFGTLEMLFSPGGSDAADVTAAGIPALDSFGILGGNYHSLDEYAHIDSLNRSAKFLAATIIELAKEN